MDINEVSNVKEFAEYLKEHLFDDRPDLAEHNEVVINEVTKNNGMVLQGLTIKNDESNIAPTIYVDDSFKRFERGESIDDVIDNLFDFRVLKARYKFWFFHLLIKS